MPEYLKHTILGRYQQLIDLNRELATILNIEQLFERMVKAAAELCQAEHAVLFLPDQTKQHLQFKIATLPNASEYRQVTLPVSDSLEGWVFSNKTPVTISDSHQYDQGSGPIITLDHLDVHSIISVPLIIKDSSIGVLEVINKLQDEFTSQDQEILLAFANQVAIYFVNTQLFVQTDLISELVHELRTPLVSLNLAMHLLQRTDLPEEKRQRIFEMINTEFNRLSDMTTSFLEYARLESGRAKFNPTSFDVQQLLAESVEVMQFQADARGIKIALQVADGPLAITADRDKMKQVMLNLINNAIKYNHLGGGVMITAQRTPTDISINIQDDGQGIAEEYLPRLFTRFFRAPNQETQTMGTGLGLSICKQIVEAHHGRLEVMSHVDQGSTFIVRLPVVEEEEFIPLE